MIDQSNNKNVNSTVTAQPLAGGQQTPAQQTQTEDKSTQTSQTPATFQTGMSSTQAGAQQQPTQQKSKGPASSGMFTNIQKYVQKNQPQAQQMAQAVTQNIGSQASEIAEQAKQKEAQMQQSLAANTAAMEAQKKEAGQIVGGIMGADYDPTTGQYQAQPAQQPTTIKDTINDPMNGIAISTAKHPNGIPNTAPTGFVDNMPKLIDPRLRDAAQKDFLGDKYDQYKADMDNALNNLVPGNDESLANLAKIEESYGLTGNWFDPYKERSFDYRNNTFKQELTPEEQQARFQELMKGPTGISEVGNLNIAQQNQRARALQQLAGTAGTEMGRRGLLQDTFRQGDREYTQGMGSLDQLITSGDQAAREALVTGVQEQAQGLQDQLQQVGSDANKAKMAQDIAIRNFGTDITQLNEDAQTAIINQVDVEVENQKREFQDKIDEMKVIASGQLASSLKYANENAFYDALMAQFDPKAYGNKGQGRDYQDYMSIKAMLDPNIDLKQSLTAKGLYSTGFGRPVDKDLSNTLTLGYGSTGQNRIANVFEGLLEDAANYGLDPDQYRKKLQDLAQSRRRSDVYGWHGHTKGKKSGFLTYDASKFKDLTSQLFSDIKSARENALQRQLENKYKDQYRDVLKEGQTYEDFVSGDWIDRSGVASQDQTSKMAALRRLTGLNTDKLGTELEGQYGQDKSFFERLKKDLSVDKPEVKTGGTVKR